MAEWGSWQIFSLKSQLDKIDINNLVELWDLTKGLKNRTHYYAQTLLNFR